MRVELDEIPFDRGGALLVKRALRSAPEITVSGTTPDLFVHLRGWCRVEGHQFHWSATDGGCAVIIRGTAAEERWSAAERAGCADPTERGGVVDFPPQHWGLAARGALVESGSPEFHFPLAEKIGVWSPDAGRIYLQAASAQWDPATAIPWDTEFNLPDEAGLNAEVFDALVLIAAGSWSTTDLVRGHDRVAELVQEMHAGRRKRLERLGFSEAEADDLSSLHTRNFM
jgi:hypothetical protein